MKGDCVSRYVAERIREIRQKKGLRVVDVSRLSGIPMGSYSCLETGRYKINLDNLLRILLALDVGIQDVWPHVGSNSRDRLIDESCLEEAIRESHRQALRPAMTIEEVVQAVAEVFGLPVEAMRGRGSKRTTPARVAAALLIRDLPHLRQIDLARYLTCSQEGISHSLRRYSERVSQSHKLEAVRSRLANQFPDAFSGVSA